MKTALLPSYEENANFQEGISQAESTATPLATTKLRKYVKIFLKGMQTAKGKS